MKRCHMIGLMGTLAFFTSCSGPSVAGGPQSTHGKPLLTRSTHASIPTSYKGEGKHVGRNYFHPPGTKNGIQWVDFYEQP